MVQITLLNPVVVTLEFNALELMLGQEDKREGLLHRQQLTLVLQILVLVFMAVVGKILMDTPQVVEELVVKAIIIAVTDARTVEMAMEV
jgi:hypothetical protein